MRSKYPTIISEVVQIDETTNNQSKPAKVLSEGDVKRLKSYIS